MAMTPSKRSLEMAWEAFEQRLLELLPPSVDRRKSLMKLAQVSAELAEIKLNQEEDPILKNAAQRYFGLDPLKISALNLAYSLESDEARFVNFYLQLTQSLILANILRLKILPLGNRKFQTLFNAQELAGFPNAKIHLDDLEQDLREDRKTLEAEVQSLRAAYEEFLFTQSSHEAAHSFGALEPDVHSHHSSWVAFAQLLTGLAFQAHEGQKTLLIKRSRRVEARRVALFDSCADLFAKKAEGNEGKRIKKQLKHNLAEIKKLEEEIEATLAELSVPGFNDYASFVVKKSPEQATTFELTKISQSTGDKT